MQKLIFSLLCVMGCYSQLTAHCQMPCGIYHDEMVFDQIDQFIETTVKAISVLNDNPFSNVQQHNEFVRWIMQKEKGATETAELILTYFLQQKIKPNEEDTAKRVISAHLLLFYLVQIKQTVDLKIVNDFYEEWERFKLMFHIEGYKCKVSQVKLKKWAEKRQQTQDSTLKTPEHFSNDDHDHNHEHDHDHPHDHSH